MEVELTIHDTDRPPVASEIPPILYWTLWVPVFCVILYGLTRLFGTRGGFVVEQADEDGHNGQRNHSENDNQ